MSSSVHFKFKSSKVFESATFEGDFLKVADLKVAIVERKKLNFGEGFDLEIADAQTNEGRSQAQAPGVAYRGVPIHSHVVLTILFRSVP